MFTETKIVLTDDGSGKMNVFLMSDSEYERLEGMLDEDNVYVTSWDMDYMENSSAEDVLPFVGD